MTPAARVNALIDLIGELTADNAGTQIPADRLLQRYFRARRYIGGGDRRAISADFYGLLRNWEACCWRLEAAGGTKAARQMVIAYCLAEQRDAASLFSGDGYAPEALDDGEQRLIARFSDLKQPLPDYAHRNCPKWAEEGLRQRFGEDFGPELDALNMRAPAVIRTNRLKIDRTALAERLEEEGISTHPTALSPLGLVIETDGNLRATAAYKEGLFAFQDEGSQIAALLLGARPGMQICDYCAGTGGKTLALAGEMNNRGQIFACDISPGRLKRLSQRLQHAGVRNTQIVPIPECGVPAALPREGFSRVIVDAPCSGSGSWRRQPELRISVSAERLADLTGLQDRILTQASTLVARGGRLLFVTCSLLPAEGEERIAQFLAQNSDWQAIHPLQGSDDLNLPHLPAKCVRESGALVLSPAATGTDGFFIAALYRN